MGSGGAFSRILELLERHLNEGLVGSDNRYIFMGGTFTNGYPAPPNWSPYYSYGSLYGTGLYSANAYSPLANTGLYTSRVIAPPMVAPSFVGPPIIMPGPVTNNYVPSVATILPPPMPYIPPRVIPQYAPMTQMAPLVASVAPISAYTPAIIPPVQSRMLGPPPMMGGIMSGGFNLFGDADPITPGVQSGPGVIQAMGPTRVF